MIPIFNGGPQGIIFRPGAANIVCGKPNDSAGSCSYAHCPETGHMKNCRFSGPEMGYYMEATKGSNGYNEVIVNARMWPRNIVEASWGDPKLPEPHLRLDTGNWEHPFS